MNKQNCFRKKGNAIAIKLIIQALLRIIIYEGENC